MQFSVILVKIILWTLQKIKSHRFWQKIVLWLFRQVYIWFQNFRCQCKIIWQQAQWATNQLVFSPFVGTVHVTISFGAQSSWLKSKVNLWSVIILLIRESPIYPISCLWSTSSKSNLRQITCLSHAPKHLNVML